MKLITKSLVLIAIGLVFNFTAVSQATKSRSLEFNISLVHFDKTTRKLETKLSIVNKGKSLIIIDKKSLLYSTKFARLGEETPDGGISNGDALISTGDIGQPYEGIYVALKPNESFATTHTFELRDSFFEAARSYKFSTTYGQFLNSTFQGKKVWKGTIESNEIDFRL